MIGRIPTTPPLTGRDFSVPGESAVYFLRIAGQPFVKIGKAVDWRKRGRELQCGCPFPMKVIMLAPGGCAEEAAAHRLFSKSRHRAEWFSVDADFRATMGMLRLARGDISSVSALLFNHDVVRRRRRAMLGQSLVAIGNFAEHFGNPRNFIESVLPLSSVGAAV